MNDFPTNVKEKLNSIISDMADHHWLFSNNPGHDFMRQDLGKLSFYDTMRMIIGMGKGSTNDEIMDYFDLDPDRIPSQSAFCQRRSRFHFPLSSICSRNSLLPFQGLPTSLKITASLHVMVVMLFTLPIRKLLRTIINLALLTTKGITTCI